MKFAAFAICVVAVYATYSVPPYDQPLPPPPPHAPTPADLVQDKLGCLWFNATSSPCSASCGGGVVTRRRQFLGVDDPANIDSIRCMMYSGEMTPAASLTPKMYDVGYTPCNRDPCPVRPGHDQAWCRSTLPCYHNGEANQDKPICGVSGSDGPQETYKNMCEYQAQQCEKGILEVRATIGACPVKCSGDGDCSDGNVCKKVDSMGVPCNGNENDCSATCEKPQAKVDVCDQMVKDNSCPTATMKCEQKEECTTGKGCHYSASCVPLETPEECKIQGVQRCINAQFQQQAANGPKGKFDTCTLLNIYTTCGKNNGCTQTYLNWCLHGLPNQKGSGQAARPYPENCDLPACEGQTCDVKAYRSCINEIAGSDLKSAYDDCGKLQKILNDCAVPNKCNIMYNCFLFRRHQPNCDLSLICGKVRGALEDSLESPLIVRTTQKPKSSGAQAYMIVGSCFGGSALVAVAAIVLKRRRSADEASYTRADEL